MTGLMARKSQKRLISKRANTSCTQFPVPKRGANAVPPVGMVQALLTWFVHLLPPKLANLHFCSLYIVFDDRLVMLASNVRADIQASAHQKVNNYG